MLLKSKVCFTVLTIYEILAVSAMHFQRICDAMFPPAFCDSWFRYFLFCVVVPLLVFLILMWVREIVRYRRRRSFIRRARNTVNGILTTIRGRVSEQINIQDRCTYCLLFTGCAGLPARQNTKTGRETPPVVFLIQVSGNQTL